MNDWLEYEKEYNGNPFNKKLEIIIAEEKPPLDAVGFFINSPFQYRLCGKDKLWYRLR